MSAVAVPSARRALPAGVWALGVTSFFTDVGSEMIFPLLPVFLTGLGATPLFYGLVEGVADFVSALLKLVAGEVADRARHKKPLVLLGYGIATVARPLMGLALAPWHALVVRSADRVGKGIRSAPRDALLGALVDDADVGRAFGLHRAMDHAGAVMGPLVATALLYAGVELRTVFFCAVVPGVLALVAAATVKEPVAPAVASPSSTSAPNGADPLAGVFFVALFVFSTGRATEGFLLLRASELGVEAALLPLVWTAIHVVKVAGALIGGRLADRVERTRLVGGLWAIAAGVALALAAAPSVVVFLAVCLVAGGVQGLVEPAEKALVKRAATLARQGRAFGFYHLSSGIAAVIAGAGIGALWTAEGARVALAAPAVTSAFGVLILVVGLRARRT